MVEGRNNLYNNRPQRLFDSNEFVADMFQLNFKCRGPNN